MRISAAGAVLERAPSGAAGLQNRTPAHGPSADGTLTDDALPERHHTFAVPPVPESIGDARRQVVGTLRRWGVDDASDAVDALRLIVSELVTNAVQHAGRVTAAVAVSMALDDRGRLWTGVRDGDSVRPDIRRVPLLACSGRGMDIVRTLLTEAGGDWGVEPCQDGGKTVWFRLPIVASGDHHATVSGDK